MKTPQTWAEADAVLKSRGSCAMGRRNERRILRRLASSYDAPIQYLNRATGEDKTFHRDGRVEDHKS